MADNTEILRRRTFAIIAHPDAGKTSLTEKLLLFGGQIQVAGAVKSNKIKKTATSDWMEIEKQRGISVTTSVMEFDYRDYKINILDTPGHQDFAEDTYRTLTAVDSVIIVVDGAKGVETQTRKLMEVCRMRNAPVIIFVNKMDREGKDPFDLLDELEEELMIQVRPLSWPIEQGPRFKGVYNIYEQKLDLYQPSKQVVTEKVEIDIHSDELDRQIGDTLADKLRGDLELIEGVYPEFDVETYLQGECAPVFFGFWPYYWNNWRMDYNQNHRGDVYATHGMGPACQLLDIHRGDKMNYLVSMDTKAVNGPAYIKKTTGKEVKDFQNGDQTSTLIRTEKGKTILIQHNVMTPRPYSRMYQVVGADGYASKYPIEEYCMRPTQIASNDVPNHEKLNAHGSVPADVKKALMDKYKHPIHKELEETAKKVGGHGGMDYIMDYRLVYCLRNGLPLDMDVYDLAEWCCMADLTKLSIENSSAPVAIPDFTRGAWNKVKGYRHAFAK